MKKVVKIMFGLGGLALPFSPLSAHTLSEAISLAVHSNPEVLSAKEDVTVTQEQNNQASAAWLPSLDLSTSAIRERKLKTGSDPSGTNKLDASLTLTQKLYDGGATPAAIDRTVKMIEVAYQNLEIAEMTVALGTIEAWYELYRLQKTVKMIEENLVEHEKVYQQIKQKVEVGAAGLGELALAEGPLFVAKTTLISTKAELKAMEARYKAVVGELPKVMPDSIGEKLYNNFPQSYSEVYDLMRANNPALMNAQAEIAAARADYSGARAGYLPTFDFELKGGKINDHPQRGETADTIEDSATATIKMTYNFFRGGADAALRRETARTIIKASEALNVAQRSADEQLEVFWNQWETAKALIEVSRLQLKSAEDGYKAALEQFKLGEVDVMAIMGAMDGVLAAEQTVLADESNVALGEYRILTSAGVLFDYIDINELEEERSKGEEEKVDVEAVLGEVVDKVVERMSKILPKESIEEKEKREQEAKIAAEQAAKKQQEQEAKIAAEQAAKKQQEQEAKIAAEQAAKKQQEREVKIAEKRSNSAKMPAVEAAEDKDWTESYKNLTDTDWSVPPQRIIENKNLNRAPLKSSKQQGADKSSTEDDSWEEAYKKMKEAGWVK
ncbi:MAG: TolC family outer membrane protein [Candidatus Marinimicrobia bacterium]|nr:TolC family outer membrane protein [Candidatus Neomarinimicrobiota bacterium]